MNKEKINRAYYKCRYTYRKKNPWGKKAYKLWLLFGIERNYKYT